MEKSSALEKMQEILVLKREQWKRKRRIFLLTLLAIVATCVIGFALTQSDVFGFIVFLPTFLLLVGLFSSAPDMRLSMDEYKALPGAVDRNDRHVCIKCGHHGIHRRGVYRSSATLVDCSRCQTALWQQ